MGGGHIGFLIILTYAAMQHAEYYRTQYFFLILLLKSLTEKFVVGLCMCVSEYANITVQEFDNILLKKNQQCRFFTTKVMLTR